MTCVPRISVSRTLKMRERPSVVPPGAAGVTKRIGRDGQSAAGAAAAASVRQSGRTIRDGTRWMRMKESPPEIYRTIPDNTAVKWRTAQARHGAR